MDPRTGELYTQKEWEVFSDVKKAEMVHLDGPETSIRYISDAVKEKRRRENKAARKARRKGRK